MVADILIELASFSFLLSAEDFLTLCVAHFPAISVRQMKCPRNKAKPESTTALRKINSAPHVRAASQPAGQPTSSFLFESFNKYPDESIETQQHYHR